MGSRGSVIPFFITQADKGVLPITDDRMTRFMITLEEGVELVWHVFNDMIGGEIYVKKIPSMNITDIAKAVAPKAKQKIIGVRPGEKIHEQMIGLEDAPYTFEYEGYFKILPMIHNWSNDKKRIKKGKKVNKDFIYSSEVNDEWMIAKDLRDWLKVNKKNFKSI
jgi:FlaA1/EpsC-like NDP-sugar epimerase